MLHVVNRTTITLEKDDLLELEQIITDQECQQAFQFLKDTVYPQVVQSQKRYDPVSGTIGHRANRYGYKHLKTE
jgi:hypothetical protein